MIRAIIIEWMQYIKILSSLWVSISLIGKVSDSCIKDLGSIFAYTKNWLVSWSNDKELLLGENVIS